jgi:hypothetical protein
MTKENKDLLMKLLHQHKAPGISDQIDFDKFYLYSIITHSTAIEGSTVTEVEAHHIEYFTQSLNNDTQNIIILSPTFHRIVHRYNPRFDRDRLCFEFANGVREAVRLDRHLRI